MIYSSKYNKNTYEDPKNSTIFELLLLLPENIIWEILCKSSRTFIKELPSNIGFLESSDFWPKWNSKKTTNISYVEPDIFIRFNKLDIIVEAKVSDYGGQNKKEWEREIQAYYNEYSKDKKTVVLYAIGGNNDFISETIKSCKILKSNWKDLLNFVVKTKNEYDKNITTFEKSSLNRIFNLIIEGFHIMGENEDKIKTDLSVMGNVYSLTQMFDDACGSRETKNFILSKYREASAASYYIYRFKVQFKQKKEIYIGLGIWYQWNKIAIELKPEAGWAKPVVQLLKKDKNLFKDNYHTESETDGRNYYINTSTKFEEDFAKAETYDIQLQLIMKFVDSFLNKYLKRSEGL